MKINVYVDGFNLYYGCLRGTPYKWLDLAKLCQIMLPRDPINKIKYFTARVVARPGDPDQPQRQAAYLRALETIPGLSIQYGHFLSHPVFMRLAAPPPGGPSFAQVLKTEKKGSDVNLATHLLVDGYEKDFDAAAIISNDSDLALPIKMVRSKLGLPVGVLNPYPKKTSYQLRLAATYIRTIQPRALRRNQFPVALSDAQGLITKPADW